MIIDATINTNTNNLNQRQSMLVTDVNGEVSSVMTSIVSDSGSGNERFVLFGGINADNLKISATNSFEPEIVIYAPSQGQSIPL